MNRLIPFLLFASAIPAAAQELIHNVHGRESVSLDGAWRAIIDPYDAGYYNYRYEVDANGYFKNQKPVDKTDRVEYDFDAASTLPVPSDWNSVRDELFFYEGAIWYQRRFEATPSVGKRLFLHFGAANYRARVYLNGVELGVHVGGFTPFAFEISETVQEGTNDLIVQISNRREAAGIPTLMTDWWNYGGITRSVKLVQTPSTYVRDYRVRLEGDEVVGRVLLDGPERSEISLRLGDVEARLQPDEQGVANFRLSAVDLARWTPERPVLHGLEIRAGEDVVRDRVGLRTIAVRGKDILLNGESVFLRGISIHEEAPLRGGRAHSEEDARILLGWAKELGCNFVRLAHYPHNEHMLRVADELGLMVWGEIPVYWTIHWQDPSTYALAEQQLVEMIRRDKNHAAVVIWSVANETPRSAARDVFLGKLIDRARALDPDRLISAATELTYAEDGVHVDDPLGHRLDVLGVNEYLGWYGGTLESIADTRWHSSHEKPIVISEFGAGARYGLHGDEQTRWSEEFQAELYRQQIRMLRDMEQLRGVSPWILMDFRSPRRPLAGVQDWWNRKGLLSERGQRKQAFHVLREFYREIEARPVDDLHENE